MDDPRESISEWRRRIDDLDLELIGILNRRARCAIAIGRIKRRLGLPIYDPQREKQVVDAMIRNNPGPLDAEGVRRLYERIIDESRRIERISAERDSGEARKPRGAMPHKRR
jgi:chorismate mutase